MSLKPLISVIGTTGVGKSRLAIEIALALSNHTRAHEWYNAKVINADSMQIYSGADIITNKVPISERQGVEHLLMGFRRPGEQYVVGQWVNDAVREIDKLHSKHSVPIVVGGTSYWMQHLIFPDRLTSFEDPLYPIERPSPVYPAPSPALQEAISSLPGPLLELFMNIPDIPDPGQAFALYTLLSKLDPPMASRWHWNDTRKIIRNIKIIKEKGIPASEVMARQAQSPQSPRYQTLILWLYSNPNVLNPRLDARVDVMLQQGLLDDIRMLRQIASSASPDVDASQGIMNDIGIFQAIGYKEFSSYLSLEQPSTALFDHSVERMKTSTRNYAKRQVKWIGNKLLPCIDDAGKYGHKIPVFLLDVADLDKWNLDIRDVAVRIVHDFLGHVDLPDPLSLSEAARSMLVAKKEFKDPREVLSTRRRVVCQICTVDPKQPVMIDEGAEWEGHVRSTKHKRARRKTERILQHPAPSSTPKSSGSPVEDVPDLDFATDLFRLQIYDYRHDTVR